MKPALNDLMQYKNPHLINRYQQDYPDSGLPPEEALTEFMKYVWICHQHQMEIKLRPDDDSLKFSCAMHEEMKDIDDMWHTFLLFTEDYLAFCNRYLDGHFFHHVPLTSRNIPSEKAYELELNRYLSFIHEHLGEETLRKWFDMPL